LIVEDLLLRLVQGIPPRVLDQTID
jgi:hypothetical protein